MRDSKIFERAIVRRFFASFAGLACLAIAATASAAPRFYVSTDPAGTEPTSAINIPASDTLNAYLFVRPDPLSSGGAPAAICGSGAGDELCAVEFTLTATDDLSITNFVPEPGVNVVHELNPTLLQGNLLDHLAPTTTLKRLGTVAFQTTAAATTGEIVASANGVDTALQLIPLELSPSSGTLIVVPEPAAALLLLSGVLALLWFGQRRSRNAAIAFNRLRQPARAGLSSTIVTLLILQPALIGLTDAPMASAAPGGSNGSPSSPSSELEPRELSGSYDDQRLRASAQRAAIPETTAEDGTPMAVSPMKDLPIVDVELSTKLATQRSTGEPLRVIIHLANQPHSQIFEEVLREHTPEIEELETERVDLLDRLSIRPDKAAARDAEAYPTMFQMTKGEESELVELGDRNEALGTILKAETSQRLTRIIQDDQAPVEASIKSLGGEVEFSTIAGNMIVALLPPNAIDDLARTPGIARIVEDHMMQGHLNNAAAATMVDPADSTLQGLWDTGRTGGIYDPAIIDTGLDPLHPGMTNSTDPQRENFCTWYLSAANGSASFDDAFTCDDNQGHGTHVAGIVGSYGTPAYPNNLGMSYGVEKMVNLKAGWRNTSGLPSMFWSDMYQVVDRALYNSSALVPSGFVDDVDGFNLSFGGATTLDDTDASRFWDSVVSTYQDTPVTISAGNSGPNNTLFSSPANAYNVITVANANDRGTTSRDDDVINAGSTVGPTANGRRKPDLATTGTAISAPNHNWENLFAPDYVSKTGTSMAAPMVLGVIMDLMDSGVFDELALKALLINTAQKNLPGMNIEADFDGWDPALGWGVMNAYAAYYHRFDIFSDSLEPRDAAVEQDGDFRLYRGVMRDEGSTGEGRDRVTMVWNREATYLTGATPDNYYTLSDLNLRLFNEDNNFSIDTDLGATDNVHQVRIGSGAPDTDVVVKAYSWSTSFNHGGATEEYALAMEDGFERVDFPRDFQGIAVWPTEVEPNEVFDIRFWLRNDSEVASHNNTFNLDLPAGFTLVSGADTQNVGSAAEGGSSSVVNYSVRAPAGAAVGAQNMVIKHSHVSYQENYGDFNWNMGINVAVDTTPPNPNPMSFSTLPDDASTTTIDMTASFASDIHDPITYYLDFTDSPSGGTGGTDSGWIASRSYTDAGLQVNEEYCYRAWARDNANFPNLTTPSASSCAYTSQVPPTGVLAESISNTTIVVRSTSIPPNLSLGTSGLLIENTDTGTTSGWNQDNLGKTFAGLTPARSYKFNARARNGDADVTTESPSAVFHTLPNFPAVGALTATSSTSISVSLNANGNSSEAQYLIENTTTGASSGWLNGTTWSSTGLTCENVYNFQARARNGAGVESLIIPIGAIAAGACPDTDSDGILDTVDNCPFIANPFQEDQYGVGTLVPDGIGDACQCGDTTDNGAVDIADVNWLRQELAGGSSGMTATGFGKCSTADPGSCSLVDAVIIARSIQGLAPGIAPVCEPALP